MQKEKWIIEIVGGSLESHGFVFVADLHSKNKYWHFEREVDGIIQRITFEDEDFRVFQTEARVLNLMFSTSAFGSQIPIDILDFVPSERLPVAKDMAENINKKLLQKMPGESRYWVYDDKESFKSILTDFVTLIEDYGFDKLAELSVEKEIIPTKEMGKKLVSSYMELNEKFILENQLDMTNISKESIARWFSIIDRKIKKTKNDPYQSVQNMLLEMTAFLSEQLRKKVGGEWFIGIDPRFPLIRKMNVFSTNSWKPLGVIIGSWKHQDINWLKEEYLLFLDSKLPVTHEQMLELHNRRCEMDKLKYPTL